MLYWATLHFTPILKNLTCPRNLWKCKCQGLWDHCMLSGASINVWYCVHSDKNFTTHPTMPFFSYSSSYPFLNKQVYLCIIRWLNPLMPIVACMLQPFFSTKWIFFNSDILHLFQKLKKVIFSSFVTIDPSSNEVKFITEIFLVLNHNFWITKLPEVFYHEN